MTSRHVPALDGIRGVAIATAVTAHLWMPSVVGGVVGVDLFFVLSGFKITDNLLDAAPLGRKEIRGFFQKRFWRLGHC